MNAKEKIAEMLNQGKITAEEADRLYAVLRTENDCVKQGFDSAMRNFENKFKKDRGSKRQRLEEKLAAAEAKLAALTAQKEELVSCGKNAGSEPEEDYLTELEERIENIAEDIEDLTESIAEFDEELSENYTDDSANKNEDSRNGKREYEFFGKKSAGGGRYGKVIDLEAIGREIEEAIGSVYSEAEREKIRATLEKCGTAVQEAVSEGVNFAEQAVGKVFDPDGKTTVSVNEAGGTLIVRCAEKSLVPYEKQTVKLKYLKGSVRYSCEFSTCESIPDEAKTLMTAGSLQAVSGLVNEKFTGFYKYLTDDEILKVNII